jgi:hypothetical protein
MKCKCGFKFSGPGEYRNCQAFVNENGKSGIICPDCRTAYVEGSEVELKGSDNIASPNSKEEKK